MPDFLYKARTTSGKDVTGTMTAASKRDILAALAQRSLFALHVECLEKNEPAAKVATRIKSGAVATNLAQLADLLRNGVPLLASLEILRNQATPPALGKVFGELHDTVAEGTSLDVAMARYPKVFGELTVSMVRAGSEGAFLEDALKRTSDFLEMQEQLRAKVTGAMIYPAVLATAGFLIVTALIVFFVPKFSQLFEQMERRGGGLPMATSILLGLSGFLGRYGIFLLVGVGALVGYLRRLAATPHGRNFVDHWKLKLPIFGAIFLNSSVSRFCRVLGTLLQNGVPLLKSLQISADSAGNRVLGGAVRASAENISSGDTLSRPLAGCGLIPPPIMAMITVAEEANNLENVLISIADTLDRRIGQQLEIMVRLVEPLLLLVMGVVILFVLTALLLPVFDMNASIG